MFIESLRIRNTVTNVIMREVIFHQGANFVVDAEQSSRHNKVGKTTFLKLIDILMGAKNRSLIYKDQETGAESGELRNIIENKRIAAEMSLVPNLNVPSDAGVELKVELFQGGRYFIDNKRISQPRYLQRLNELLFDIKDNTPTFRQLINSFVRVSVSGDDDAFLRTLDRASKAEYRSVYNFLFRTSNPLLDKKLDKLTKKLRHTQEACKQYKQMSAISDIDEQQQVLIALETEYDHVKTKINDICDSDEYKHNRETIASVRAEYSRLTDALSEVDYKLERNSQALESAQAEKARQADLNLSRKFFDEVCTMLPSLNKTFEEMVNFNNKLCDNKISYFEEIGIQLLERKTALEAQRKELLSDNTRYLSLVENNRIDEYESLINSLVKLEQEIGRRKEIINTLKRYDDELAAIQKEKECYSTGGTARTAEEQKYQEMMSSFNKRFTSLAKSINGEQPILVYSPDTSKFPVSITELSGSSTGTRKSLLAAFDLAYQQFAIDNHITTPRFVVHDVIENIEGKDLKAIVTVANAIDAQYIVAVLKEKLDSSGISEEEQDELGIMCLAEDDKLFEGKTVDSRGLS